MTKHDRSTWLWRIGIALAIVLNILGIGFLNATPNFAATLAPAEIAHQGGQFYSAAVKAVPSRFYLLRTDSNEAALASSLKLFENGQLLGPPHSLHSRIVELGGGRYSHWQNSILFSTSDGTDPRSNGRTYAMTSPTVVKSGLRSFVHATVIILDIALLLVFWRAIAETVRRRPVHFAIMTMTPILLLTVLAASGAFGTIVLAFEGFAKDAPLVWTVVLHAALGCVTSVAAWAAGAGLCVVFLRDKRASLPAVLIPAFPLSLLLLAALLAVALAAPGGRVVTFGLWLACLLPLIAWRPPAQQIANIAKATVAIVPLAMAFGIWLGLLWHGPTASLPGAPTGDLSYYAGTIWSLDAFPFPNPDIGYEAGATRGYFNSLYPALGAALLWLPGFDPFIFLLASGGTSYILLTTLMLHLYLGDRALPSFGLYEIVVLILTFVVAARYPYWVVESIPMVAVPALTMSVWWMAERGMRVFGWSIAGMLAGLIGSILSKVVTAAVLVPLAAVGCWRLLRTLPSAVRLTGLVIGAVFGAYCIYMLAKFMPAFIASSTIGPESYRTPRRIYVMRDLSALLLIALAWMTTERLVALVLTLGMATFLAYSWIFQVNFVCVTIVLGLVMVTRPDLSVHARRLAIVALGLSLPAALQADMVGFPSGVAWSVCLGLGIVLAAVTAVTPKFGWSALGLRHAAMASMATIAIATIGLIGVARGKIIVDSGWHIYGVTHSPQLRDIWSAVRRLTPIDALIFTDQTDETQSTIGGWNTYAYAGQRQIFLSSYVTTFTLRNDASKLRDVLAVNTSVIDGKRAPRDVETQHRYGSYYAVVLATRQVPATWRKVHGNAQYALYEILP